MSTRLAAAALAGITLAVSTTAPAIAKDGGPTVSVYVASDNAQCFKTPNSGIHGKKTGTALGMGTVQKASERIYPGVGMGQGSQDHRRVEIASGKNCFVPTSSLSEPVPVEDLDPAKWEALAVYPDAEHMLALGGLLAASHPVIYAFPHRSAPEVGEALDGQVFTTSAWQIESGIALGAGEVMWQPVAYNGSVAWMQSEALVALVEPTAADLTSSLTPTHEVTVWTMPSLLDPSEPITSLTEGETYRAGVGSTAGFLPVEVDDQIGWVSQVDLMAAPEPTETAAATPTPGEPTSTEPGLIEDAKDRYEEWKSEREDAKAEATEAGEPGLWERMRNAVTGENPVARAAAKGALYMAGALGVLALLLAGLSHAAGAAMRRKSVALLAGPQGALGSHALLPASAVVAVWAAMVAPNAYFTVQVLAGAAVVGGGVGFVAAHRVASMLGRDTGRLNETYRVESTPLLLAGVALGAVAYAVAGASLAVAVVVGLIGAGAWAGSRVPKTGSEQAAAAHMGSEAATRSQSETTEEVR